jgi:hypothetical protein
MIYVAPPSSGPTRMFHVEQCPRARWITLLALGLSLGVILLMLLVVPWRLLGVPLSGHPAALLADTVCCRGIWPAWRTMEG